MRYSMEENDISVLVETKKSPFKISAFVSRRGSPYLESGHAAICEKHGSVCPKIRDCVWATTSRPAEALELVGSRMWRPEGNDPAKNLLSRGDAERAALV